MFSLPRVAPDTLLCGIYEASARLLVLYMEGVPERLVDPQATLLADWLSVGGGV
jgi:hypothetical protein